MSRLLLSIVEFSLRNSGCVYSCAYRTAIRGRACIHACTHYDGDKLMYSLNQKGVLSTSSTDLVCRIQPLTRRTAKMRIRLEGGSFRK